MDTDRLNELLVIVTRIDERLSYLVQRQDEMLVRIDQHERQLATLDNRVTRLEVCESNCPIKDVQLEVKNLSVNTYSWTKLLDMGWKIISGGLLVFLSYKLGVK